MVPAEGRVVHIPAVPAVKRGGASLIAVVVARAYGFCGRSRPAGGYSGYTLPSPPISVSAFFPDVNQPRQADGLGDIFLLIGLQKGTQRAQELLRLLIGMVQLL